MGQNRTSKQVKTIELWLNRSIKQREAVHFLGVTPQHFRRQVGRYQVQGIVGLYDKRQGASNRRFDPKICEKHAKM